MRAHLGHQIPVALVNERAVKFRAFFRKLEHHARKVGILLELFNRFRGLFFGFIIGKQGLEDIPQKPAFVPEAVVGPNALERNIDISVNQADRYVLNADLFVKSIDSCSLYVNASTRFTDGGEFGLGAEIGISTQKLHVRGPMGLTALTTTKYLIDGDGHTR